MAETNIPIGHPMARKIYGGSLFSLTQQKPSLMRNMTGVAPKQADAEGKMKGQSSPDFPIVRVTDLETQAGGSVTVDMFNTPNGLPVMGDEKIAGKMMDMTSSTMEVRIDQCRGGISPGGRMTQKRTPVILRNLAMASLVGWNARLEDQSCQVHLAGARGSQAGNQWVVPLDTHPAFSKVMVNPVLPPTYNRHFYAGAADSLETLDTTDGLLTLDDISRLRSVIDDSEIPLQPIRLPDDPMNDDEPLFLLLVSARQWHFIKTAAGDKAWRTFVQNAYARKSAGTKHPLFSGEPGLMDNILVRVASRAIRFAAGETVSVATNSDTFSVANQTCAVETDRAILLGAQALVNAYGKSSKSGTFYDWHEEETDHGNALEISTACYTGKAKARFKVDGVDTDHGVMVIDSYAPDPKTTII